MSVDAVFVVTDPNEKFDGIGVFVTDFSVVLFKS